jgi:predicted lipoprotein with Yx(FWY)xxD motif
MRHAFLVLCLVAAGCGSSTASGSPSPDPSSDPSSTASQSPTGPEPSARPSRPRQGTGAEIITADSEYGTMLYDASGQPIYLFDAETTSRAKCYGECAEAWPPVLTKGTPRATGQVSESLLGTTQRSDGTRQVTYAGHPLYFYAHEGKYEVLCHDVEEYGGTWLVVRPDGTPAPG